MVIGFFLSVFKNIYTCICTESYPPSDRCRQRCFMLCLQHLLSASTPDDLLGADLRPVVEALLGVGASERDVGVLDLDTGVVDFSFYRTN